MPKIIQDINPFLPDSEQIIPSSEGGKGTIHHPGHYQNVIWQTRRRVPDGFEKNLIAALEDIFESGVEELDQVVSRLNAERMFDRNGAHWTEGSFQQFLSAAGY